MVEKMTDANFEEKVMQAELPVLVDFYADWCGPCKMMGPVVEKMAEKYEGKLIVGKLNVDENPQTAAAFRVQSIPYLALIRNGQMVNSMLGATSSKALEEMIETEVK